MKKNRTMRVAALMLALTLITSCFVGSTFAKYTTELTVGGASDGGDGSTARVAKFGVEITANKGTAEGAADISLFKNEYTNAAGEVIVQSTDYVVAPGTSNADTTGTGSELFGLAITGTPEVAVKVKYDATVSLGSTDTNTNDPWVLDDGTYYCPLIFTIGGVQYKGNDPAYTSLADFEAALTTAINFEKDYAPGTDLATVLAGETTDRSDFSISWEWPFEGDGTYQTDAKDTALGNAAAATTGTTTGFEVSFEIKASVTQINDIT